MICPAENRLAIHEAMFLRRDGNAYVFSVQCVSCFARFFIKQEMDEIDDFLDCVISPEKRVVDRRGIRK
jgi:hypothetical protein